MSAKKNNSKKVKKDKPVVDKPDTKTVSLKLFKSGKNVEEIAKERNFTPGTIEGHLTYYVGKGDIDINDLVPAEKQKLIASAIAKHGLQSHKSLIDNLPGDISYGELRMVLAAGKNS